MPNIFAFIVLYSWPLLVFLMYWRLPIQRAFIWSILLGYLFMPPASAAFNLPALPEFTKLEISAVSSALMAIAFHGVKILRLPKSPIMLAILAAYILAPVFTIFTNTDTVEYGQVVLQGLSFRDVPSLVSFKVISAIPFILAYSILDDFDYLTDILVAIVIAALVYSMLILLEVRISPQLNIWIYGFFQHTFLQMIRGDGYRSIVFLYHALWVGFFIVMGVVAALSLYKNRTHSVSSPFLFLPETVFRPFLRNDPRFVYLLLGLFFVAVLIAGKSLGPILFGVSLTAVILVVRQNLQLTAAMILASIVLIYPWLRASTFFPEEFMLDMAGRAGADRAASLAFRFLNEGILLERASERMLFGWGAGARNLLLDPISGRLLTIPDGGWIITLGQQGLVGFAGEMGLILAPIFLAFYWRNIVDPKVLSPYVPAICLLLTANAVDMLPNATLTPLTFLLSGAIWRHLEGVPARLRTVDRKKGEPMFGGVILPYDPDKNRTVL